MSRGRLGESLDLALVCGAAVVSAVLVALPPAGLAKALALVPLVVLLPGYALTAAMHPPGAISRGERLVYSLSLSVGAAALGGLLWQLAFDLGQAAWTLLLVAVTLIGAAVAQRRRAKGEHRPSHAASGIPTPGAATGLALAAAILVAAGSIAIAIDGVHRQRAESHFSSLWIVPARSEAGVEVGVWNHQGAVHRYGLTVERGGTTLRTWKGRLGANQRKELLLGSGRGAEGEPIVVSLYRDGVLYRRAKLALEGGA